MDLTAFELCTLRDNVVGDIRRGFLRPTPEAIAEAVRTGAKLNSATAARFIERFFDRFGGAEKVIRNVPCPQTSSEREPD